MPVTLPSWDEYAPMWARLHGGGDPRRARPTVRGWLRSGHTIARTCARLRIRPGAITAMGLLASIMVPVFAAQGPQWLPLAAVMVVVAALADTVDGALAIITERTTRLGYVYDSVVDRVAELIWLLAFWLVGVPAYVVLIAGALTFMHEYVRARANAAGMTEIGGVTLGERPTRVILTAVGLALAGAVGLGSPDVGAGVATFAVAVWIVLSVLGFLQLFATIHRVLHGRRWPPWPVPGKPPGADRAVPQPSAEAFAASEPPVARWPASWAAPAADEELRRAVADMAERPRTSAVYTSSVADDEPPRGRHAVADKDEIEESPA